MQEKKLSLPALCKELSISEATGRNWIKLGKLVPSSFEGRSPRFDKAYVKELKHSLTNGANTSLKSRRNKTYISGRGIYSSYVPASSPNIAVVQGILDIYEQNAPDNNNDLLTLAILAECALQLLTQRFCGKAATGLLGAFLTGDKQDEPADSDIIPGSVLVRDILSGSLASLYPEPLQDSEYSDAAFSAGPRDNEQTLNTINLISSYPEAFSNSFTYIPDEDTLGLLYISLRNLGKRKAEGAYYTPTDVVKKLCDNLFEKEDLKYKDILDPCCGTGNFMLQLPESASFEHVYGSDTDPVSVKLARINYCLKFKVTDPELICSHITVHDFLIPDITSNTEHHLPASDIATNTEHHLPALDIATNTEHNHPTSDIAANAERSLPTSDTTANTGHRKYDYILGNPPWGSRFTDAEKAYLKSSFISAHGTNIESYDVFTEAALRCLVPGGLLSFVLPEAILNVRYHRSIREVLLSRSDFEYVEFLGDVFDSVQCPSIILKARRADNSFDTKGLVVADRKKRYTITSTRRVSPAAFDFFMTDEEYEIIEKMDNLPGAVTLKDNADFALGIVTGDNKRFIKNKKTPDNEIIVKGSDLRKYYYVPSDNYVAFTPGSFQQVADERFYRAKEKLFYKFISSTPVFALDNTGALSLNSCNILIPRLPGLDIRYILAVLNSDVVSFYCQKRFNSIKVLRSHIENIPIPMPDPDTQGRIIALVDEIIASKDDTVLKENHKKIEIEISHLYGLDENKPAVSTIRRAHS